MPAAGVQPVQRRRRELVAEFGWLPGDHEAVAAAADVDDGLVRLVCHAVPGLGEVVAIEGKQPCHQPQTSVIVLVRPGSRR